MEDFDTVQGAVGSMIGDYSFLEYLERERFNAILNIITNNDRQMRTVIKGGGPHC